MNLLKSIFFNIFLAIWSLLVVPIVIIFAILFPSTLIGHKLGRFWRLGVQFGMRFFLRIRYEVSGLENIPQNEPCIFLANHQSAWETFCLQDFLPKNRFAVFVLKQELLNIPLVGNGFAALKMIAIDRKNIRSALKEVINQGKQRLDAGFCVIIFPEGTRVKIGEIVKYQSSGVLLAMKSRYKIIPIAHNSGEFWGRSWKITKSGVIQVKIGKAISPDDESVKNLSEKQITQNISSWILEQQKQISPDFYK